MMRIDKNSRGTIAMVVLGSAAVGFVFVRYVRTPWIVWPMIAALLWLCAWQIAFFRVPRRRRNGSGRKVSSVADGVVVILEKAFEPEYLKRECIQLSVYMNFFDVHANFWPLDGKVSYYKYIPGKHWLAFEEKASLNNEHTCVCITTDDGHEVLFKQIAGGFARRIVCYAGETDRSRAGSSAG